MLCSLLCNSHLILISFHFYFSVFEGEEFSSALLLRNVGDFTIDCVRITLKSISNACYER